MRKAFRKLCAVTEGSQQPRTFLQQGKKIIIITVQKFPFILDEIEDSHHGRTFAMIFDDAHSSQGDRASAKITVAPAENGAQEEDETVEDNINRLMEARKVLPNASYFAFTAPPKNQTLEIFGSAIPERENVKHVPFEDGQVAFRGKGVYLRILDLGLETSTSTGELALNMRGAFAQFERQMILERQREGIAKAKTDGKYK